MEIGDGAERGPLAPQRVLVTGGAGFIGSHLVDWLAEDGHQVTVLDDLSAGGAWRLAPRLRRGEVELVEGSITEAGLAEEAAAGCGTVFHLAAAVGVRRILADPLGALRSNLQGTEKVLRACARHGCRAVVASSSEVYGDQPGRRLAEDGPRVLGPATVPRWSYAAAKAADEHLAFAYAAEGLPVSVVRYFNCYGPRLDRAGDASVVGVFIRQALAGEPISVFGTGAQTRSFTYVTDTVRGTVLAASARARGQVFNIGCPTETSVRDLAGMVAEATGSRSRLRQVPYEQAYGSGFADVSGRVPDITRAREVLGWEPLVPLGEGLKRTIAWWSEAGG